MSTSDTQNIPNSDQKNIPIHHLDQKSSLGKWIFDKDVKDLAIKKFYTNGKGITFFDLINQFGCSKHKAQLRLKNACKERIDKNGKKSSILFRLDDERTNPQMYYPSCLKAKIIENRRKRKNIPISTTGVGSYNKTSSPSSSNYPLYNAIEHQMLSSFLLQLSLLPFQPLHMHNIRLWMPIDKSHYEELTQNPSYNENKTKIQKERIGLREVIFKFHKKGSIEIEISCSKNPFPMETDNDVNNFFVFLGQVKYTLAIILNDPRERIVPSVDKWILKCCDFNKDIELDDKNIGQLMDLNIQIKHAGKAFRLYVKNLDDRFELRGEKANKVDQPITDFIDTSIPNPLHLINSKINEFNNIVEKRFNEILIRIEKIEENK